MIHTSPKRLWRNTGFTASFVKPDPRSEGLAIVSNGSFPWYTYWNNIIMPWLKICYLNLSSSSLLFLTHTYIHCTWFVGLFSWKMLLFCGDFAQWGEREEGGNRNIQRPPPPVLWTSVTYIECPETHL